MKNTIFVNQIGYSTSASKFAFIDVSNSPQKEFSLCTVDGKSVFTSTLTNPICDELCNQKISTADFSAFTEQGTYKIVCGEDESFPFKIQNKVYEDLYKSTLTYFTLSRCGHRTIKSEWSPEDCHTSTAKIYGSDDEKTVIGGWHDAGDYGRYVVAGAKAILDLLFAYQYMPNYSDFNILDEVRFELEWMLQMQREDGAVYHKISCYHFCPFIMPNEEKEVQVLAPISTAATADFAGSLAFASTIYRKIDSQFADKLLNAALLAQKFIENNDDILYENPSEITTGSYGDKDVRDEKFFALCGLFVATKDEKFLNKILEYKNLDWKLFYSWGMVNGYGAELLIQNEDLISNKTLIEQLKNNVISRAEEIHKVIKNASFKTSLLKVFWGSNGAVCDAGHTLLLAYKLTGNKEYYESAKNQLDYILGCNPLNICYVTGFGSNSVKNPHHRPSGALKKTMPGMLSGGPSAGLNDVVARENLQNKAPLLCYIDHVGSYSTNEIAIYWNSPLVLLIAGLGLI